MISPSSALSTSSLIYCNMCTLRYGGWSFDRCLTFVSKVRCHGTGGCVFGHYQGRSPLCSARLSHKKSVHSFPDFPTQGRYKTQPRVPKSTSMTALHRLAHPLIGYDSMKALAPKARKRRQESVERVRHDCNHSTAVSYLAFGLYSKLCKLMPGIERTNIFPAEVNPWR